jgi:hypothetical protein
MQTVRQRAALIMQYEQTHSKEKRDSSGARGQQWHPTFLHMLVPKFELDEAVMEDEDGVINGVKRYLDAKLEEQERKATEAKEADEKRAKAADEKRAKAADEKRAK